MPAFELSAATVVRKRSRSQPPKSTKKQADSSPPPKKQQQTTTNKTNKPAYMYHNSAGTDLGGAKMILAAQHAGWGLDCVEMRCGDHLQRGSTGQTIEMCTPHPSHLLSACLHTAPHSCPPFYGRCFSAAAMMHFDLNWQRRDWQRPHSDSRCAPQCPGHPHSPKDWHQPSITVVVFPPH